MPATEAFRRSGRSLLTRMTPVPSAARLAATARMRAVVGVAAQAGRQRRQIAVVHLDAQGAAGVVDRHGLGQLAVLDAQRLEPVQHLAGGPAQLRVVALGFQLADHRQGEHELVLLERAQRRRIGEQDAGVEHVGGGLRTRREDGHGSPSGHGAGDRTWLFPGFRRRSRPGQRRFDLVGALLVCPPRLTVRPPVAGSGQARVNFR